MSDDEHWCQKCWLTKRTIETKQGWICQKCLVEMGKREIGT